MVVLVNVAVLLAKRMVLRVCSASSARSPRRLWTGWPALVFLVAAFRSAAAERTALATGSARSGGCSSAKVSSRQAWRRCHSM